MDLTRNGNQLQIKMQMVLILHVSMNEQGLEFSPSVDEVSTALTDFCQVLAVAARGSLVSTRLVFQLIKDAFEGSSSKGGQMPRIQVNIQINLPICCLRIIILLPINESRSRRRMNLLSECSRRSVMLLAETK